MVSLLLLVLLVSNSVSGEEEDGDARDAGDNKIVNGEEAAVGEFPFIVSIQMPYRHSCGGSLLRPSVVLTACHCLVPNPGAGGRIEPRDPSDYTVVGGLTNLAQTSFSSYRRLGVNRVEQHPKCEKPATGWNWDIGIMQLRGAFPMITDRIELKPVPDFSKRPGIIDKLSDVRAHCTAAGWGFTNEMGNAVSRLMKVDLALMPVKLCEETIKNYAVEVGSDLRFLPEAQICTLGENGKDACKGDSGGPLICDTASFKGVGSKNGTNKAARELIAVVSWGFGCGRPDVPGAWSRLDVAYDWIVTRSVELQRTAPDGSDGILKKDLSLNLVVALINMCLIHLYS